MKKTVLLLANIFVCCSLFAYDFEVDNFFYSFLSKEDNTVMLMSPGYYSERQYRGDIVVPETVSYKGKVYDVVKINGAFSTCANLTSVSLPQSIEIIADYSFNGCNSLQRINIPSKVKIIDYFVFEGCTSLSTFIIDDADNSLEFKTGTLFGTLSDCPIKELYLGRDITYETGDWAHLSPFTNSSVENVVLGNRVTSLSSKLFMGCTRLYHIDIPEGIVSIGDNVFDGCTNLSQVSLPSSLKQIGSDVFYGCHGVVLKSYALTPPEAKSVLNVDELEVLPGLCASYARTEHWKEINIIFSQDSNERLYPVILSTESQNLVSLNDKKYGDWEVKLDEDVNIKVHNIELLQHALVLRGGYDISNELKTNNIVTFKVSERHKDNTIREISYNSKDFYVPKAGGLLDLVDIENIDYYNSLVIRGELNGTDIRVIRRMNNLHLLDLTILS